MSISKRNIARLCNCADADIPLVPDEFLVVQHKIHVKVLLDDAVNFLNIRKHVLLNIFVPEVIFQLFLSDLRVEFPTKKLRK